jgi:hypothetical protein
MSAVSKFFRDHSKVLLTGGFTVFAALITVLFATKTIVVNIDNGEEITSTTPLTIEATPTVPLADQSTDTTPARTTTSEPEPEFRRLPFSDLFSITDESGAYFNADFGGPTPGVYTTPERTFSYALKAFANEGETFTLATIGNNSCRSVRVRFVPGREGGADDPFFHGSSATVSIVQEGRQPQSATAQFNDTGTVDATLSPGSAWSMNSRSTVQSMDLFIDGSAECRSGDPLTTP